MENMGERKQRFTAGVKQATQEHVAPEKYKVQQQYRYDCEPQ